MNALGLATPALKRELAGSRTNRMRHRESGYESGYESG
jgi:hypothetical protein